jgi:hypothetical protein
VSASPISFTLKTKPAKPYFSNRDPALLVPLVRTVLYPQLSRHSFLAKCCA